MSTNIYKAALAAGLCVSIAFSGTAVLAQYPLNGISPDSALVEIADPQTPLAAAPVIRAVSAPGVMVEENSKASVDYSNSSEGYIMVKFKGTKAKLQLTGSNAITYTYNLSGNGYEAFPLTSGSGSYTINVYQNVRGSSYSLALRKVINVQISNSLSPYLYPNQYVNYDAGCQTVALGASLAAGASSEEKIVENVYNWVTKNITYDYNKANTMRASSGYLPDVDEIINSGTGICFDYAAVMATMLRTQNIPTRMEVGYISTGTYHAWISVYLQQSGWVNGIIQFDGNQWKLMDPTIAAGNNGNAGSMAYINNTSNYKKSYVY